MSVSEVYVISSTNRSKININSLIACDAGKAYLTSLIFSHNKDRSFPPAFHRIVRADSTLNFDCFKLGFEISIYQDDSALVVCSDNDILIVTEVRPWIQEIHKNSFTGLAWDAKALFDNNFDNKDLKTISEHRKELLIYCMGEEPAMDWFVKNGGVIAQKRYVLNQDLLRQTINSIQNLKTIGSLAGVLADETICATERTLRLLSELKPQDEVEHGQKNR